MNLGQRIQLIRGSLSRDKFSTETGISKNTLVNYEKGERTPDAEYLNKLLTLYPDLNPTWLLTGEEKMLREESSQKSNTETSLEPCGYPSHSGLFPKEFDPELLLHVTATIDEIIKKKGVSIPKDRQTKVAMLAYADAFWRGKQVNREYLEYLTEVSSLKEGVLTRERVFIEAAAGGLSGGFVIGEQLPEAQGWLGGIKVVELTAEKKDDTDKITNKILGELRIKPDRNLELRARQLKASFEDIYKSYRHLVVVIYDAHLLSKSSLQNLKSVHELTLEAGKFPGIVLLGPLNVLSNVINSVEDIRQRALLMTEQEHLVELMVA